MQTGGIPDITDDGYQRQASGMAVKDILQLYASGSQIYLVNAELADAREHVGGSRPSTWRQLTPEASRRVRKGNYGRIFDEGRRRVRKWEQTHAK